LGSRDRDIAFDSGLATKRFRFESCDNASRGNVLLVHHGGNTVQPVDGKRSQEGSSMDVVHGERLLGGDERVESLGAYRHFLDMGLDVVSGQAKKD
jgi:hypothetical protein